MKNYTIDEIRNVALIGHAGTGKTTLAESLLYHAGTLEKPGSVEKGNTLTDYHPEEIKRKISIHLTPAFLEYRETKINILDSPGVPDFCMDTYSALRIAETAIFLVDAENGLQIETERNWMEADKTDNFRCICFTKMDKERADFNTQLDDVAHRLEATLAPMIVPIGAGEDFKGVINVLTQKAYYPTENSTKPKIEAIPEDMKSDLDDLREKLIEAACEGDDELMEKFLEGEELSNDQILNGLNNAFKDKSVVPVICTSAEKEIGISAILDFLVDYLPSPAINKQVTGKDPTKQDADAEITLDVKEDAPFSALVFKTIIDQYAGRLSYFKVMSGTVKVNDNVYNVRTTDSERISRMYYLQGKTQVETGHVSTGDIGAFVKLERTKTGDTLCTNNTQIVLTPSHTPPAISFMSITAATKGDEEKLNENLQRIFEQDPSYRVGFDAETKQTVIQYMGDVQHEVHMSAVREKLPNLEIETGVPRIAYRETVRKPADADYRHKKQSGGHGQFGQVHLKITPQQRGVGFEFANEIVGGAIPKQYIPGVEKGVVDAMEAGVVAKYPVQDIKVAVDDGKYHDVDSSEMSFRIAAKQAMKEAMKKADPVLLEPVMKVKIFVPESYTGSILNDLNGKRAQVLGMEKVKGTIQKVEAFVPLSEMLRYSIDLKSITSGAGTFEMEFDHYNEISGRLADKVVEERAKMDEEEEGN